MINISYGRIKYLDSWKDGNWGSYAIFESLSLSVSSLTVGIGIKGLKNNPDLVQIEIRDPFQPKTDRQVMRYDLKNNTRKIYWTSKKVIQDIGPDILSKVIQSSPEFPQVIKENFNINLIDGEPK